MRRPLLAVALLAGVIATALQQGSTAGNAVPPSTAVYRSTAVTGATLVSLDYTTTGGTVTALTVKLRGVELLAKTVTAHFGSDPAVSCIVGASLILDVTQLTEATYTCAGFAEPADRPRPLQIAAS